MRFWMVVKLPNGVRARWQRAVYCLSKVLKIWDAWILKRFDKSSQKHNR